MICHLKAVQQVVNTILTYHCKALIANVLATAAYCVVFLDSPRMEVQYSPVFLFRFCFDQLLRGIIKQYRGSAHQCIPR